MVKKFIPILFFGVLFDQPPMVSVFPYTGFVVNTLSVTRTNTSMTVTETGIGQFSVILGSPGNLVTGSNQ